MGDRAKSRISAVYNLLSSRRLNIFLAAAAAAYSFLLVIWAAMSPLATVYKIGTNLPFKAVLVLFAVNNVFCMLKQFKISLAAAAVDESLIERARTNPHFVSVGPVDDVEAKLSRLKRALSRRGYRVSFGPGKSLIAVRGRLAPLGTLVFHAALLFLVVGIIVGAGEAVQARLAVAEGERFVGAPSSYAAVDPPGRRSSIPKLSFKLKKVKPRFWKKQLLFTDLYADISFPAGKPVGRRRVRLNVPWKPRFGVYVSLTGLGYAPRYRLTDPGGRVLEENFVKLTTFPPGSIDKFTAAGRYHVELIVYPDASRRGDKIFSRSLNLREPLYDVRVTTSEGRLFQGLVGPGETIVLEPGVRLEFPEIRYWGEFRVVRNPGLPFLWLGFLLLTVAAAWRLLWYQKQAAIVACDDGRATAAVKFDYHRVANELKFKEIAERALGVEMTRDR